MDTSQVKSNTTEGSHHRHAIHRTLLHSYNFYFIFFLVAIVLDLVFTTTFIKAPFIVPFGFVLLGLATLIILWAQISFVGLDNKEVTAKHFSKGPYRYTRNPTHWGLFFLILGFGLITNAFFVVLFIVLSHLLAKMFLIKKHEKAMSLHFGSPYEEYKKLVKF